MQAPPRPTGAGRVFPTLRDIVAKEGWSALARGIGPRVLFHVPVRTLRPFCACVRPSPAAFWHATDTTRACNAGGRDLLGNVRDGQDGAAKDERRGAASANVVSVACAARARCALNRHVASYMRWAAPFNA